jgi:hypothetical protein
MDPTRPIRPSRPDERAQLTIDFLIGIVTFLVVVGLVFTFIPEMLVPFTSTQSAHPIVADRTATHLAENELAEEPGALDGDAVVDFFDRSDDNGQITTDLGISEPTRVTVTIRETSGTIVHERGPSPPTDTGQVTTAQRSVIYDEETHYLVVEVW